jgi:hypothetical protein
MSDTPISPVVETKTPAPVQIKIEPVPQNTEGAEAEENNPEEPIVVPTNPEELMPTGSWETSPLFYELANFLGVDSRDYEANADKISLITEYAINKTNSNKVEDIMHTIREMEEKLQPAPWGQNRASHLYQFLRMAARYDAIKKATGAFTKKGVWE